MLRPERPRSGAGAGQCAIGGGKAQQRREGWGGAGVNKKSGKRTARERICLWARLKGGQLNLFSGKSVSQAFKVHYIVDFYSSWPCDMQVRMFRPYLNRKNKYDDIQPLFSDCQHILPDTVRGRA